MISFSVLSNMYLPRNLCLILLIYLSYFLVESKFLYKRGSSCPGGVWKHPKDCNTIEDKEATLKDIVAFKHEGEIAICCPSSQKPNNRIKSILNCIKYQSMCKVSSQDKKFLVRKRRQMFHTTAYGGEIAEPKYLTFMALLGYGSEGRQSWECGASIISEQWVLSAAHCNTHALLGRASWIRVGELDLESSTEDASTTDYQIVRTVIHPDYNEKSIYNDIALFKAEGLIKFNDYVLPICLKTNPPGAEDVDVFAAGWGTDGFGGVRNPSLMEVDLLLVKPSVCKEQFGTSKLLPKGIDTSSQICAAKEGKGTCTGDSGGPLYTKSSSCIPHQIGITSFGRRCGPLPGVYTWLHNYIEWIENIVW